MTIDPVQYARRWKTLGVLSLSLVIIGLDNTILNVALPTLQHEFDASPSKLQWMVDSYLLVFAGLLLVFGTLGDRFGRKRRAPGRHLDLRARQPRRPRRRLGRSGDRRARGDGCRRGADHARHALDHRQRLHGRGARQGDRHLGCAGGGRDRARPADRRAAARVVRLVVRLHGQRAVRRCGAAARHPLRAREPRSPARLVRPARSRALHRRLQHPRLRDHRSARARAGRPASSLGLARGVSIALLGAFVWWERRIDEPMLDLGFFRSAGFSVGTAAVSVAFFALLGGIFALTQYLQFAHGYSAIEAGAIMSPMALGLMMGAGSSSKAAERLGISRVVAVGLTGLAVLLALTTLWEPSTGALALAALVLRARARDGLGHGPGDRSAVVGAVPAAKSGVASATNTVARMVSGALGVAVIGSLVSSLYSNDVDGSLDGLPAEAQAGGRGLGRRGQCDRRPAPSATPPPSLLATTGDAFTQAMGIGLLVAAALAAGATAVVVVRFLPARERPSEAERRGPSISAAN